VFVHVTVVPTAMARSSGAYALFPSDEAPTGIAIDDGAPPAEGAGDGIGEGVVDGVE
jgi:hypothetical protein